MIYKFCANVMKIYKRDIIAYYNISRVDIIIAVILPINCCQLIIN